MAILVRKKKEVLVGSGFARLSVISLLAAFAAALVDTVWAVYIDSFVHSEVYVGFLSAALTLVSFVSYFVFIPFIEKHGKSKIYVATIFLFGVTYILFAINKNFYIFVLLAFFLTILYTFRITSFGIIVKDKSKKSELAKNEGLIYTFSNISWVVGPLIAGYISQKYGFSVVFILAAVFVFLASWLFILSKIVDDNVLKKEDKNILANFLDFFKDRERAVAYFVSGGVNMWWVLIYIFVPLHIIRSDLNELWVGYFLFGVAVPLILTEYYFSRKSEVLGFRKTFKIGFGFVALISFVCFFVLDIYWLLGLLVIASFGIAMLEPTTEAYFLDILKTKREENRFYGPYNTTIDVNMFLGKIISSIILIFLPFQFLFLFFGFLMLGYFFLSGRVRNIIESKRK